MAMIPLGHWGEATDAVAAGQIARAGSRAQDAVDRRLRLRILPYITDMLASSSVIRMAAIIAIDRALADLDLSTPHIGVDDDGIPYVDAGKRTARLSTEQDAPSVVRRNRAPVPIARQGNGWLVSWGTGGSGAIDYPDGPGGTPLRRHTWTQAPTAGETFLILVPDALRVPASVGTVLPVSVLVSRQAADGDRRVQLEVIYYGTAGRISSSLSPPVTVGASVASAIRIAWTPEAAPAGTTSLGVRLVAVGATSVGDTLVAGALMIGPGEYFDGDTTSTHHTGRWTGTANASLSELVYTPPPVPIIIPAT